MKKDEKIKQLELKIRALKECLGTTLSWIGGSANSPLSVKEIKQLMKIIEKV